MRVFVCSVDPDDLLDGLTAEDVTFGPPDGMRKVWSRRWGRVSAVVFSDDGSTGAIDLADGRVLVWAGYLGTRTERDFFLRHLRVEDGCISLTEPVGGIAAFALVDPGAQKVVAWSTQPGVEAIYYSDCRVSNRPCGVVSSREFVFNRSYLDWYLSTGYALDESTPYEGVRGLAADACVWLGKGGEACLSPHPNPPMPDFAGMGSDQMAREGARVLCSATSWLLGYREVELFLSDGKDSRLLAAAMATCGVRASATTMALPGDAVSAGACRVAEVAGLPWVAVAGKFDAEAVHSSLTDTLRRACGILNCEANVDLLPSPWSFAQGQAVVFGHSHLQKGGLVRGVISSADEAVATAQRRIAENPLACPDLVDMVRQYVGDWVRARTFRCATDVMYWVAHDFRVTKYLRAHYHRQASHGAPVYPLIDEHFARFCGATDMMPKADESFMFKMLALLSPAMRDLPVPKRWKFEAEGASDVCADGHLLRTSVLAVEPAEQRESIWNSKQLISHAREVVLGGRLREDLLDRVSPSMRAAVLGWDGGRFFPAAPSRRLAMVQLYRMYCATVLCDEVFASGGHRYSDRTPGPSLGVRSSCGVHAAD